MHLPAELCKMQRKKRETDGFSKSTFMTPPGSHPTSGFGTRHSQPSFLDMKNAASYKTMRQIGGPRGIRTLDLSDANRTLSQQSRFCAHLIHREKRKIDVYSSISNVLPSQRPFLVASMVSNLLIFKVKQFGA